MAGAFLLSASGPAAYRRQSFVSTLGSRKSLPARSSRKWFGHDPQKWDTFRRRYARELDSRKDAWRPIVSAARRGRVTLVYSSHDTEHNNAVALQQYPRSRMRRRAAPARAVAANQSRRPRRCTRKEPHLRFTIRPVPPFRLDLTVWALRRRARNLVDRWDGTTYRRVVVVSGRATELSVRQAGPPIAPRLDVTVTPAPEARRPMWSCDGCSIGCWASGSICLRWYHTASRDPRLGRLADRFRGVKPPRFPTVFEALVNAFACQQLSLESGLTLLNRLAAACGTPFGPSPNAVYAFPAPEDLAHMPPEHLRAIGFSRQKARALLDLAGAVTRERLNLESLAQEDIDLDRPAVAPIAGRRSLDRRVRAAQGLRTPAGVSRGRRRRPENIGALAWTFQTAGLRRGGPGGCPWQPYAGLVYFHLLLHGLSLAGAFESRPRRRPRGEN